MPAVHIIIKGKVQGVFYRATAKDEADRIGIKGWVKNTTEGHVEAMASGNEEQLKQFIEWCKKGSSNARVTDVAVTSMLEQNFDTFQIKR